MSKLRELYEAKTNFIASKPVLEQQFAQDMGNSDELYKKLAKLKQEKKIAVAKFDLEILQVQAEIAETGVPSSKTARDNYVRERIREERLRINTEFETELRRRSEAGEPTMELVAEMGAKHAAPIYSILRQDPSEELSAVAIQAESAELPEEWFYVDNKLAHRYAFNEAQNMLKYHGDDSKYIVVAWPSLAYIKGTNTLATAIESKRAQTALDILNDVHDGSGFPAPNPYKENK